MWKIGDLDIDGPVVLGPMSGFSFDCYRHFMKPFGVALSFTEMISANGLIYGHPKTPEYVRFEKNGITAVQLFASCPEVFAEAAKKAISYNPDIDMFDINMGCPVPKIVRSGAGSALMKDSKLCGRIVSAVKEATGRPVTAKIRLGWNSNHINFRDVLEELESSGVDAITIHARTKEERYAGYPHYDLLADLRSDMSVPLIVSGNIYSLRDAADAMRISGAEGVMLARGGIGNPYLATQIDRYVRTGEILPNPTVSQQVQWCKQFSLTVIGELGEETGLGKLRSMAQKFISGCRDCREYRRRIAKESDSIESLYAILDEVDARFGDRIVLSSGRGNISPDGSRVDPFDEPDPLE